MESRENVKVLVTGATGLIGSYLTEALAKEGNSVRSLVEPDCNKISRLAGLDVEIIKADIRDVDAVEKAVKGCDQVYHLAAQVSSARSKQDIYAVNVEGTRNADYYHTVDVLDLVEGLKLCATTKNIEGECYILVDREAV